MGVFSGTFWDNRLVFLNTKNIRLGLAEFEATNESKRHLTDTKTSLYAGDQKFGDVLGHFTLHATFKY